VGHLLCADSVILRHTLQFVCPILTSSVASSCGANAKRGTNFCWHSPDAEKVSEHLSKCQWSNRYCYYVCFTCYRTHCSIIESLKSKHGSDKALQQCVDEWVSKHSDGNNDKLTDAILKCVIYVAYNILLGKAMLLPWACKVFLQA